MENMTYEQLVATFGEEVAKQMQAQMMSNNSGGGRAPFTFLRKIATHGSEVGQFGEFAFGVETEKQSDGTHKVVNVGTNVGTAFEFVIVHVSYQYKRWNEGKQKTEKSNIFATLDGIKTAVELRTGTPLPADKAAKDEAKWKLVRINAGLVRKNNKAPWEPCIWETDGSLYFSLGEVLKGKPNNGWLSGVAKIVTKLASKGATQYTVVDTAKSSFEPLPKGFFDDDSVKSNVSSITTGMNEYIAQHQYTEGASNSQQKSAPAPEADDNTDW